MVGVGCGGWVWWRGGAPGMTGWGGVYHSHWVVHSHVVTKTLGVPSMAVSGAKKSRLKRNDMYFCPGTELPGYRKQKCGDGNKRWKGFLLTC